MSETKPHHGMLTPFAEALPEHKSELAAAVKGAGTGLMVDGMAAVYMLEFGDIGTLLNRNVARTFTVLAAIPVAVCSAANWYKAHNHNTWADHVREQRQAALAAQAETKR